MGLVEYARWLPFGVVLSLQLFALLVVLGAHLIPSAYVAKHSWSYTILNVVVTLALGGGSIGCYLLATLQSPGHPRKGGLEAALGLDGYEAAGGEEEEDAAEDHDGPSAPLLLSQPIPGQPRLPSRTGRSQLDDLSRLADRAEGLDGGGGIVRMADMQVKSSGEKRWCNKCSAPKPDRAHHCSTCGTCVLRMDHHCPWLASRCVGLRNHKAFFLFLFYTSLFCAWSAQDMARMLLGFVEAEPNGFETSPISWAIVFFIAFIFGMALKQARKLNIYDVGWATNWRSIMGETWWMWFLPLGEPDSDGFEYLVNAATLAELHKATSAIRTGEQGQAPEPPERRSGQRFRSAHGTTEWGPRPKKDFVLYGVGDDSEEGEQTWGSGGEQHRGEESWGSGGSQWRDGR